VFYLQLQTVKVGSEALCTCKYRNFEIF